MTGGVVVVIGKTGRNFAAGMSGGIAYVLDEDGDFETLCNMSMVDIAPIADEERFMKEEEAQSGDLESHGLVDISSDMTRYDVQRLRGLIENHVRYTGSARAQMILDNWDDYLPKFAKVMPIEYRRALEEMQAKSEDTERAGLSHALGG